jgi:hypothetical protein
MAFPFSQFGKTEFGFFVFGTIGDETGLSSSCGLLLVT